MIKYTALGDVMKIKENSFMITFCLLPIFLLLTVLKLSNFLEDSFYYYFILILGIILLITFIISLFFMLDEIIYSQKKYRLIFVFIFSFLYLPIYYVKYINKEDKVLGYSISIACLFLVIVLYPVTKAFVNNYYMNYHLHHFALNNIYNFVDKNRTFTIYVDNSFNCNNDLGEYAIACERSIDDSFIGIYHYQKESFSEGEFDDIKEFHLEQTLDILEENNYTYEMDEVNNSVLIKYNEMNIWFDVELYNIDNQMNILVIVKEGPEDLNNYLSFQKMVETIEFIK